MGCGYGSSNGKAEAHASGGPRPRLVYTVKPLEYVGKVFCVHADAGIHHAKHYAVLILECGKRDASPLRGIFYAVVYGGVQKLFYHASVSAKRKCVVTFSFIDMRFIQQYLFF